jgi:(1->4)-alpha-D-glucan 1-alpha-D-glucosylmutase
MREAKVHTTWPAPNSTYENAVVAFVEAALNQDESKAFLAAFLPFQAQVARLGVHNSLVQTVLKLTCPGVPDVYQGADLWDLSMVDPDNRRPVDYARRVQLLKEICAKRDVDPRKLLGNWQDGAIKLFVTSRVLSLRASEVELFASGEYEPLAAAGAKADCVCAFARRNGDRVVTVVAARFPFKLESNGGWKGTSIPAARGTGERLRNLFTGGEVAVHDGAIDVEEALAGLPVAVLVAADR